MKSLITEQIHLWTTAQTPKTSGRGNRADNQQLLGIQKLRELILELAVRGKLVPQDPTDEPASVLLKKIEAEKKRLIKEGKIKKQEVLPEVGEDEKPFELPQGWIWERLGNITTYGIAEKAEPADVEQDTWVLDLEDIEKETSKLLQKVRFNEKQFRSSKNRFNENDVIYGKLRPYLDKVIVADEKGVCTTEMVPLNGYGNITPYYLRLAMKTPHFIKYASESTHGMNLPRLGTEKARLANFPLPPLAEQHRIVAKVDELMALCDQLEQQQTENNQLHQTLVETLLGNLTTDQSGFQNLTGLIAWQRIANNFDTLFTTEYSIDQLKQTILQLAVMGKLVPQNPTDEPASELLKKIAKEKARLAKEGKIKKQAPLPEITDDEKPFELPEGWEWVRLGNVARKITDGTHHSPPNIETGDFMYVSAKNIKNEGVLLKEITFVTKAIHNEIFSRCDPEFGDILYIKDGATTGITTINNLREPFSMLSSVALIKVPNGLLNYFLLVALRSPYFYEEMRSGMTGVAITRVTLNKLNSAIVPLPPIYEQHRIVAKVDELFALCDALKERLAQSQTTQNLLAESVVAQALGCRDLQSQAEKSRLKTASPYTINEQISFAAEP